MRRTRFYVWPIRVREQCRTNDRKIQAQFCWDIFLAAGPLDEQAGFLVREQATPDGLAAKADSEVRGALEARKVGGGVVVAHGAESHPVRAEQFGLHEHGLHRFLL